MRATIPAMPAASPAVRRALPALLAALALGLAGCGESADTPRASSSPVPTVSPAATPAATPATTPSAAPVAPSPTSTLPAGIDQQLVIRYTGGVVEGDTGRVKVALGSRVRILVSSDVAEEGHLHTYDIDKLIPAGGSAEWVFTADIPGQIELELHEAKKSLVRLVIS